MRTGCSCGECRKHVVLVADDHRFNAYLAKEYRYLSEREHPGVQVRFL